MLQTLKGGVEKHWLWLVAGLYAVQIMALAEMGRDWIDKHGVKLWTNAGVTGDSSRQVADWYTFSHIAHGMLFYWLTGLVGKWTGQKWPMGVRFLAAVALEVAWEIFENTSFVIDRYRHHTAAVDYKGDTILNSGFDTIWMVLGFTLALKLPVRWVIALMIAFELIAGWAVRDNLTLNVLTFIWPIQAVVDWQSHA